MRVEQVMLICPNVLHGFARVLDLYGGSHAAISAEISGAAYTEEQIAETVKNVWTDEHYLIDPHGACGFRALQEGLQLSLIHI